MARRRNELEEFLKGLQGGLKLGNDWQMASLRRRLLEKRIAEYDRKANAPSGEKAVQSGRQQRLDEIKGGRAAQSSSEGGKGANDPVSSGLQPHEKGLLNAIAGPESAGKYNIRYGGLKSPGKTFDSFDKHPGILERTTGGKFSSAAGRYQFTRSTWNSLPKEAKGDGKFTPENQDRAALWLARSNYKRITGEDLDTELKTNGLSPKIIKTLGPTWHGLKDNPKKATAWYNRSITPRSNQDDIQQAGDGRAKKEQTAENDAPVDPGKSGLMGKPKQGVDVVPQSPTAALGERNTMVDQAIPDAEPIELPKNPGPPKAETQAVPVAPAPEQQAIDPAPQQALDTSSTEIEEEVTPDPYESAELDPEFGGDEFADLGGEWGDDFGGEFEGGGSEVAALDDMTFFEPTSFTADGGMIRKYEDGGMVEGDMAALRDPDAKSYSPAGDWRPEEQGGAGFGDAIKAGFQGISQMFGLGQTNAALPGTDPAREQRVQAFARNEGRYSPEEMGAIRKGVDPNGEMGEAAASMYGLYSGYRFHLQRGEVDKARNFAASYVLAARENAMRMGALATEALRRGDKQGAIKAIRLGFNQIPNGQELDVEQDDKGQPMAVLRNVEGGEVVKRIPITPQVMAAAAQGLADGSQFYANMSEAAGRKAPQEEQEEKPTPAFTDAFANLHKTKEGEPPPDLSAVPVDQMRPDELKRYMQQHRYLVSRVDAGKRHERADTREGRARENQDYRRENQEYRREGAERARENQDYRREGNERARENQEFRRKSDKRADEGLELRREGNERSRETQTFRRNRDARDERNTTLRERSDSRAEERQGVWREDHSVITPQSKTPGATPPPAPKPQPGPTTPQAGAIPTPPKPAAPAAPALRPAPANVLAGAKAAIAKGAPADKVIERLKSAGFSAEGL